MLASLVRRGSRDAGKIWIALTSDKKFNKGRKLAKVPSKASSDADVGGEQREWIIEPQDLEGAQIVYQPSGTTLWMPPGAYHTVLTVYPPEQKKPVDQSALLLGACLYEPQNIQQAQQAYYHLSNQRTGANRNSQEAMEPLYAEIVNTFMLGEVPHGQSFKEFVAEKVGAVKSKKGKTKDMLAKARAAKGGKDESSTNSAPQPEIIQVQDDDEDAEAHSRDKRALKRQKQKEAKSSKKKK